MNWEVRDTSNYPVSVGFGLVWGPKCPRKSTILGEAIID